MIEEVDHWIGVLLNRLDASGLERKTVVIFTSDHGDVSFTLWFIRLCQSLC